MAIYYAGGTRVHQEFDADTQAHLIDNLKTQLVNAGWTLALTVQGWVDFTLTGLPANDNTVTIDGVVFTWKNSPTLPTHIQIGADAATSATNMYNAVNAYGHPTVDATNPSSGVCRVTAKSGTTGIQILVSETTNNATWASSALRYGGYKLDSALTPHSLKMRVYLFDDNTGYLGTPYIKCGLRDASDDTALFSTNLALLIGAGKRLRVIANKYQFFTYELNTTAKGTGTVMAAGVPYVKTEITVSRCMWGMCDINEANVTNGFTDTFRTLFTSAGTGSPAILAGFDSYNWAAISGTGTPRLKGFEYGIQFENYYYLISEPLLAWCEASSSGVSKIIGALWDAVVVNTQITPDLTPEPVFDSHTWHIFGGGSGAGNGTLLLAVT